jgi:small subunit ribosomal protein S3
LRADIDYGFAESFTAMGLIGVKVWIYKGEVLPEAKVVEEAGTGEVLPERAATATEQ